MTSLQRDTRDTSAEALRVTGDLLAVNPEHYTAWNVRRSILSTQMRNGAEPQRRWLLEADLELTEHALRSHPKVYWIWNHRKWCLQQSSATDKWTTELRLVERMLDLDGRNCAC